MNLIIAVFFYLGIHTQTAAISEQDIAAHQTEITQTINDPNFVLFYDSHTYEDAAGILQLDLDQDH